MKTKTSVERSISRKTKLFLLITFIWTWFIGIIMYLARIDPSSVPGMMLVAALYMPSPFVAALIVEKGLIRNRLRFPKIRSRQMIVFLLAPVITTVAFVGLYFLAIYVFGNLLQVPGFGHIATTTDSIVANATAILGQQAVDEAGAPPQPLILILVSLWGAVVAGWTINALFAMGEEYGWRGLLWDEFKEKGFVPANVIVGSIWGLWHAPLILLGYNYPGQPLLGILLMVLFAIGFSFVLSSLRKKTNSVWPVAAAHGMFNALAVLLLLFLVDANTLLTGPLGVLGAIIFTAIGIIMWRRYGFNNSSKV